MDTHEGYTELGLVGFTDKGAYRPEETYVKNDLVHKDNAVWRCLQDNTSGVTPTEGQNWSVFIRSQLDLSGITVTDEHGILGEPSQQVQADTLINALAAPAFDDTGSVEDISTFQKFLEKVKTGTKITDFFKNFVAGMKFVLHTGQLVNNGLCTESGKFPLDAAYGKTLLDMINTNTASINTLNSDSVIGRGNLTVSYDEAKTPGLYRCDYTVESPFAGCYTWLEVKKPAYSDIILQISYRCLSRNLYSPDAIAFRGYVDGKFGGWKYITATSVKPADIS